MAVPGIFTIPVWFTFAYLILLVRKAGSLVTSIPTFLPLLFFFAVTLYATVVLWSPFQPEKDAFLSVPSSPSSYAKLIRAAAAYGDTVFAQTVFSAVRPMLSEQEQREVTDAIYLEHSLRSQQSFWDSLYTLQPMSRDTAAALAVLAHRLGDHEQGKQYLERLRYIEPNDPQLPQIENLYTQGN